MNANDVLNEAHDILLQRQERYDEFHITAFRTASLQTLIHEERSEEHTSELQSH